ncbi:MAG: hypothetical protein H0U74_08460 [Bradymonadaceae bacterium]|nr:hypothetical protein [Lujinxingiaceae bacterium]
MQAKAPQQSYAKQAVSLITATLPMLGVNMAVYAAFFVASVIWFAFWAGLSFLFAKISPAIAYVCIFFAVGAGAGLVRFAKRYILYMVKGAHIAAMTEKLKGRHVPGGLAQLSYGRSIIEKHFKDVSMLFGLDMLINGTLKMISRRVINITSWIPLPDGAKSFVRILIEILNRSLSYVDEAILSYAIYREEDNVWNSARHGIVLYGQCYKPILITAAKVYLIGKVFFIGLLTMFLLPAAAIIYLLPDSASTGMIVVHILILVSALFAARLVELALFEPFALAYTMVTYHAEIAGKVPDPAWDQRLQGMSDSFKKIVERAGSAVSKSPVAQLAPAQSPPGNGGNTGL